MTARTLWKFLRSGQLRVLLGVARMQQSYYRLCFLGTAARSGLLARLADGPVLFEQLASELVAGPGEHEGLRAWLDFGVHLGELGHGRGGYALRGWLARRLADPTHDAAAALITEAAGLHHTLLSEGLERLHAGRPFTLADQDGELIARSSRILEPLVCEAIDEVIPARGPVRLLEIGCGTGTYVRYAAERNPSLTAVALDLQPEVAQLARQNLHRWQVADRVVVEAGDVRTRALDPAFDVVTLHNNIYYFPVAERVPLLAHVRGFLRPGGRLLLTTACQGGAAPADILNVWAALTRACGRLPAVDELERQLLEAGYTRAQPRTLLRGARYYAFVAEVE